DGDGLFIRSDDPRWDDPDIAQVLSSGLAAVMPRTPPLLSPVGPDAAFARLLLHWQHAMEDLREQFSVVQLQAIKLQQVTIRAVASRRPSYRCGVIAGGYNVSALRE